MRTPMVSFRCPPELLGRVRLWMQRTQAPSQGGALVSLLTQALDAQHQTQAPADPKPKPTGRRGLAAGVWQ